MPLTLAEPNFGCVAILTPEIAEPLMKGAMSIVVGVFNGKMNLTARAVGAKVPTVTLTVAASEVPPGPVAL